LQLGRELMGILKETTCERSLVDSLKFTLGCRWADFPIIENSYTWILIIIEKVFRSVFFGFFIAYLDNYL